MSHPLIGMVDAGMGNRRSVEKALERVGARVRLSDDPDALRRCDGLVLPGVGAFPRAIANLRSRGLDELLRERFEAGLPILGICLGFQLAFDDSVELGGSEGLGLLPGTVRQLDTRGQKLPHIGWSEVSWRSRSPLLEGVPDPCALYHVHSFAPVPADPDDVLGVAEYGSELVTAARRGSFTGVQFHPEKSSLCGLRMLSNFVRLCARSPTPA